MGVGMIRSRNTRAFLFFFFFFWRRLRIYYWIVDDDDDDLYGEIAGSGEFPERFRYNFRT